MNMDYAEIQQAVYDWRNANAQIPAFWNEIYQAFMIQLTDTSQVPKPVGVGARYDTTINPLLVRKQRQLIPGWRLQGVLEYENIIHVRLPSKRVLTYHDVTLGKEPGTTYEEMTYATGAKTRAKLWGGVLTENVVQAIAADLLRYHLELLEHFGYEVVMHVHDEIVIQVPVASESTLNQKLDDVRMLLSTAPPWAAHLPLDTTGWVGTRYRKD